MIGAQGFGGMGEVVSSERASAGNSHALFPGCSCSKCSCSLAANPVSPFCCPSSAPLSLFLSRVRAGASARSLCVRIALPTSPAGIFLQHPHLHAVLLSLMHSPLEPATAAAGGVRRPLQAGKDWDVPKMPLCSKDQAQDQRKEHMVQQAHRVAAGMRVHSELPRLRAPILKSQRSTGYSKLGH